VTLQRLFIEGVRIDNIDSMTALDRVETFAHRRKEGLSRVVFFANVHSLHLARKNPSLLKKINAADLVLPDGSGLALAGRLFGVPIRENVNGTDFLPRVLARAAARKWSVFLLGGRDDILEGCSKVLTAMFPGLEIVGTHHGHWVSEEQEAVLATINTLRPDLLLVGMGSPIQENWIIQNAATLEVGICFGVGGLFDFLAGDKPRAPRWLRKAGLEWIFRFLNDPVGKWYRVIVEIPAFLVRVIAARIMKRALLTNATHVHHEAGGM
jgi:N-acetylglucosaminyldiphosphoundecaprenol N-acetyl-beta-D-mannosaminyltransferase